MSIESDAIKVVNRINALQHDQYALQRLIERHAADEAEQRKHLADLLKLMLAEDEGYLDNAWVTHWMINGGDSQLHELAIRHMQDKADQAVESCPQDR